MFLTVPPNTLIRQLVKTASQNDKRSRLSYIYTLYIYINIIGYLLRNYTFPVSYQSLAALPTWNKGVGNSGSR